MLVIVADDMRLDHLPYMPNVRHLIQQPGRTFTNARCNVALCQPNRVGFFTGQASRHHNEVGIGFGAPIYDGHDNTVAKWLADAGSRTALIGKYVNYYDHWGGVRSPPGWATWRELLRERTMADYDVYRDRTRVTITDRFQSEYLGDEARAFVGGDQPWFCYLSPKQAHSPFAPRPEDLHGWAPARCRIVPVDEANIARKPPWMRRLTPLREADKAQIQQDFRGRLRELTAVDALVKTVIDEIEAKGQLDDTVIAFTSDNGVHQGEQRRIGDGTKAGPYDVGLRVPLLVRGPGFAPGPAIDVPVYPMQDITATAVAVGGASAGLPNQAGISLSDLVKDPLAHSQRALLHEVGEGFESTADGITTGPRHKLGYLKLFRFPAVRSGKGGPFIYEMYDLDSDPDELHNLADSNRYRSQRNALEDELLRLLR